MTSAVASSASQRKSPAEWSGNIFKGGIGVGRGCRIGKERFGAAGLLLRALLLAGGLWLSFAQGLFAQTNFATLAPDGSWTWMNDPRAVFHNGVLYFGYARSDGHSALSAFDPRTGQVTNLWESRQGETDDFGSPAVLAKEDGGLVALFSRRGSDQFFSYRLSTSTNPVTSASWGRELRNWTGVTAPQGMTYSSPFQLSRENGRIYNFTRYLNNNPNVFTSEDGGATWSRPTILIQSGTGSTRPYVKCSSDGDRRIDIFYSDGHPRDIATSLYHMYYEGGAFHQSDGTFLKNYTNLPIKHDSGERGSVIYTYNDAPQSDTSRWIKEGRPWCWDIARTADGHPACVFSVRCSRVTGPNWFDARIYYYYARWTGTEWQKRFIAQAGRPLYEAEQDFAGGICLDQQDPNVVYISSDAADPFNLGETTDVPLRLQQRYELWRGTTTNNGQTFTWEAVTSKSARDNLRPFVPPREKGAPASVVWLRGTYSAFSSFNCEIVGLFPTPVPVVTRHWSPEDTITAADQVRALTRSEAALHVPVRLRGIVLGGVEPEGEAVALQDETAGIRVQGAASEMAQMRRGDVIEVEGTSDPGDFAPQVRLGSWRKFGPGVVPAPRAVTFDQIITGRPDAQWIEVRGLVRGWSATEAGSNTYHLDLATGGGRLDIQLTAPAPPESLVDSEVLARGVCLYQVNNNRQAISPLLVVPRDVPILVETRAPADPYALPAVSVGSLMQFAPDGSYGHRLRVRGAVTRYEPGKYLWIRSAERGLRVQTRQEEDLKPGDEVDVLGFPASGDYTPVLEDAVFRKQASGPPPNPTRLSEAAAALDHDADLVECEARLTGLRSGLEGLILEFQDKGAQFRALLNLGRDQSAPAAWQLGSLMRVRGVCSVSRAGTGASSNTRGPQTFQLLLNGAGDLAVIQPPPWWSWQHAVWLSGAVVVVLLLVVAVVTVLARRRLQELAIQRARAEAEFRAILAERNRLAGEIHDTLAQGLGAISMHLELVKERLPDSEAAAQHLKEAHRLVRDSLADARTSIWNMRSQVLEKGDLAAAFRGILQQLTDGSGVKATVRVMGQAQRLPPVTENNLLRLGQEAITNATKHAHAKRIAVTLEYGDRQVRLQVTDDGRGFDTKQPPRSESGFGLTGMRERAARLQGELAVRSVPGEGTEVTLTAPVTY